VTAGSSTEVMFHPRSTEIGVQPVAGTTCQVTANSRISSTPSTNTGVDSSAKLTAVSTWSSARPAWRAAATATGTARPSATTCAATSSSSVTGSRSRSSSATGTRLM
jgi:hypothetical protein